MTLANVICEKCGMTLAVLDKAHGEPVVRLTTGLVFHTEGAATCPGCGHETKLNLDALEQLIPSVSNAV